LESGRLDGRSGAAFIGLFWFNLFDLLAWEMKAGIFIWLLLAIAMRLSPARPVFETRYLGTAVGVWLILLLSPPGQANWRHLQLDQARFGRTAALSVPPPNLPTIRAVWGWLTGNEGK
jgi:hypothetical protein